MAILKIKDPTTGEWQEVTVMQGKPGPQGPAGPNEITTETQTNLTGLIKGNGTNVQLAEAGTDYATPDDAKTFVVTFTKNDGAITADKTVQEIIAAHKAKRMILGVVLDPYGNSILQLISVSEGSSYVAFAAFGNEMMALLIGQGSSWILSQYDLAVPPASATVLPASGTALTADTIYNVSSPVGTYVFTPPDTGWAHGKFTTGTNVSVSFSGTFMGAAPTIEASKTYEFDVYNGVWAVQEVVSA